MARMGRRNLLRELADLLEEAGATATLYGQPVDMHAAADVIDDIRREGETGRGSEEDGMDELRDSSGRRLAIGDRVRWRGAIYTVTGARPGEGRADTAALELDPPPPDGSEVPDEIGVDLVTDGGALLRHVAAVWLSDAAEHDRVTSTDLAHLLYEVDARARRQSEAELERLRAGLRVLIASDGGAYPAADPWTARRIRALLDPAPKRQPGGFLVGIDRARDELIAARRVVAAARLLRDRLDRAMGDTDPGDPDDPDMRAMTEASLALDAYDATAGGE